MSYPSQRALAILQGAVTALLATLLLGTLPTEVKPHLLPTIAGSAALGAALIVHQWRRISRMQTHTFQWYRAQHPEMALQGRLWCHACGSDKIQVRALMKHTCTREHVCSQCNTSLFYSREMDE